MKGMYGSFEKQSIQGFLYKIAVLYPAPINLNYLWNFGSLAGILLVSQILSGLFLACWYIPMVDFAFESVEFIMREVNFGWFVRYLHANGASMFFIVLYLHLFRGLYFGSYMKPREFVWVSGMIILILVILTAFLGYVLPWGQMSYWAATVITSLVGVFPKIGESLLIFLWGGFFIDQQTLTKFYMLHFLLPFLIFGLVCIHIVLLHEFGSNNPLGIKHYRDSLPFGTYFVSKDIFGLIIFLILFMFLVFFFPNLTMHPDNYIKANFEVTPEHIVPEWYFLPFYGLLRTIPNKILGVLCLILGLVFVVLVPFFYESLVRSGKFKPLYKIVFWFFFFNCILLGWSGGKPVVSPFFDICIFTSIFYFFLLIFVFPFSNAVDDVCFVYIKRTNRESLDHYYRLLYSKLLF
jgi:quinol-cytochrome oxidoreductase complex cytochrome b subunit